MTIRQFARSVSLLAIAFLAWAALAWALFGSIAHADSLPLAGRLMRVADRYTSDRYPPVDTAELGRAIATVTTSREWAAFLLAMAVHESGLAERIRIGDCRIAIGECDRGRAWGLWQNHRALFNLNVWGSPDLTIQARAAARLATRYYNGCRHSGVPFPLSTFRALGGLGCTRPLPGEAARVATYNAILKGI